MNDIYSGIVILGIVIAASVYRYSYDIKCEIDKLYGNKKAKEITIEFFKLLLIENQYITLDEAILKFEKSDFDTLEEFARSKNRKANSYREAYQYMFDKSKKKAYPNKINGFSFNNFFY